MTMVHLPAPRETERGSAGEQPLKGYLGGAHRADGTCPTDRAGVASTSPAPIPLSPHRTVDPLCLQKRIFNSRLTCVQGTGRGTFTAGI